jgi:hypothetical protein
MVHEHHHEKQPLKLFASPLLPKIHDGKDSSALSSDLAGSRASDEGLTSEGVLQLNHNDDHVGINLTLTSRHSANLFPLAPRLPRVPQACRSYNLRVVLRFM